MKDYSISLKAQLETRVGASELLVAAGDAVLIVRGRPRWIILRCPCGCGEEIPVNVDARAGKAWRLYQGLTTGLTLFPSVWRDTGCESHFVIWRDRILMFGPRQRWGASPCESFDVASLSKRVLEAWPDAELVSFVEVADALQEIPWDVQEACKKLVTSGALVEGIDEHRGKFCRKSADLGPPTIPHEDSQSQTLDELPDD